MAIDTAVMEQLLQNLLKLHQQQGKEQSAAFTKLAKAAGLDPKMIANAESKLKALGDAAENTAKSTSKMSKAGAVVGSALADLTTGVMGTAGNLVNFGAAAMAGTAKVSDFFAAFKDLPIIGTVASLFAGLIKLQEDALESWSSLSESGINLGGSLVQLRLDAGGAGLTLQEYTKILKENSETLVQMGGSASLGAKNFNGISKAMKDGGLTQELLNLGFTTESANATILQYAKVTGGITKQALTDQAGLAASSARYGKELDFLARLTGESRESLQKKLEEEAAEANWQAFLASKDQATRDKLTDGLQKYTTVAGRAGAEIFKAAAQNISVQGEAGQATTSLMGDLAETISKDARRANDRTISAQDYFATSTRNMALAQVQSARGYQQNAGLFQALQAAGDPLGAQMGVHAKNYQTLTNSQGNLNLSIDENIERLEKERRAAAITAKTEDAEAASLRKMQQEIRDLGTTLWNAFNPLIQDVIMPLVRDIAPQLPKIAQAMAEFVKNLFTPEGREKIIKDISQAFSDILDKVGNIMVKKLLGENVEYRPDLAGKTTDPSTMIANANNAGLAALWRKILGQDPAGPTVSGKVGSGRSAGSWGTVGSAFENFGNGTPLVGHGNNEEGMFTVGQINKLMAAGTENNLKELISQLNNTQAELVYQMRQVAENSRRNVQATESLSGNAFA